MPAIINEKNLERSASEAAKKFLAKNPVNKNMAMYVMSDSAYIINEYESIIQPYEYKRAEELASQRVLIGVELPEYPKLPNGKPFLWWYDMQLGSCQSCLFFQRDAEAKMWNCENPKISDREYRLYVENLGECPQFAAGSSQERIDGYKVASGKSLQHCMAALTKMGIVKNENNMVLPSVGQVKIFKYDPQVALAADLWNKSSYYYMQNYVLYQGKKSFEYKKKEDVPFQEVPEVQGEDYLKNTVPYELEDNNDQVNDELS